MSYNFMHDVWLRSIIWRPGVSDILCTAENPKSKTIKKLSLAEDAMGRFYCESSFILEIGAQLVQLGDPF